MTRRTSARVAGFTYLFYTAIGICNEAVMRGATNVVGNAAQLARIGEHASDMRVAMLLTLLEAISAIVLAVALYGITRDQDRELATLAMLCRVTEGALISLNIPGYWQLLWLAKAGGGAGAMEVPTMNALRAFLLMPGPSVPVATIFFAVGSALFAYLFLRGRIVPAAIAWLGVFATGLLVVTLPLQLAGFFTGPPSGFILWVPALVFQLVLAPWLLIKGVATPATR